MPGVDRFEAGALAALVLFEMMLTNDEALKSSGETL